MTDEQVQAAALADPDAQPLTAGQLRQMQRVSRVKVLRQRLGMTHGVILFIVTTMREEAACRIMSARKATRREQDRYYAGDREAW